MLKIGFDRSFETYKNKFTNLFVDVIPDFDGSFLGCFVDMKNLCVLKSVDLFFDTRKCSSEFRLKRSDTYTLPSKNKVF